MAGGQDDTHDRRDVPYGCTDLDTGHTCDLPHGPERSEWTAHLESAAEKMRSDQRAWKI